MVLGGVRPGDIVLCDVRGDRFYAEVVPADPRAEGLQVRSLTGRPIPALHVTSRQVVAHWRKSKQSKV